MKKIVSLLLFLAVIAVHAQQDSLVFGFEEYLGYVKKYHPVAKQAQLTLSIGQAKLLKARGGFDPKVEVDYDGKRFQGTEYWDRINGTFKIPTYYGIELKAAFQKAEGEFINRDENFPEEGIFSAGVSISLGKGFWINERMATLRKAKFFREQAKADQDLLVNKVLFDASIAYFDWLKAYNETQIFTDFLKNAQTRFEGVKKRALQGDIAIIDTVEANIAVQNRALSLEQSRIALVKKALKLSNFLWINDVPVELQPNIIPDVNVEDDIDSALEINEKSLDSFILENHPKLRSLDFKIRGLRVDKRFKANKLLPKIDLEYNFLTEANRDRIASYNFDEYKAGINFSYPIFTRKERGDLKLAKFKLQDTQFERDNALVEIQNKVVALYSELDSYTVQNQLILDIVGSFDALLRAEERKFGFGESSLFLINSRESKLIDASLKRNELQNKFFSTKAKLFKSLAINPTDL